MLSTKSRAGRSWTEPGPEIKLFPLWTEMYGASNPHPLSDGRYLFGAMGTMGRDKQWRAGVTFCDPQSGYQFSPPVIVANDPQRDYSDTDLVRLDDGRFLAVVREHILKKSVYSHSEDDGRTWSPIRYTGFLGANLKLLKLRSGAVICAYRNEDPGRRGVSVSVTENGGETWREVGNYMRRRLPSSTSQTASVATPPWPTSATTRSLRSCTPIRTTPTGPTSTSFV